MRVLGVHVHLPSKRYEATFAFVNGLALIDQWTFAAPSGEDEGSQLERLMVRTREIIGACEGVELAAFRKAELHGRGGSTDKLAQISRAHGAILAVLGEEHLRHRFLAISTLKSGIPDPKPSGGPATIAYWAETLAGVPLRTECESAGACAAFAATR